MKQAARRRLFAVFACLASLLTLGGCAQLAPRDAIADLSQFQPLAQSDQVRYAPQGERFARQVAALLPQAIDRIEAAHDRRFRSRPVVYICGDDACFERFVDPRWNFSAAVVYDNRLLLSRRLFEREPQRVSSILLHELSHLHLGQRLGHYSMGIPVWFHEGLASYAAHGGGADLVSDDEAWAAAARDRHFLPAEQHLPWRRRMAVNWKLPPALFYRQAMLFVESLHRRDPDAFEQLLAALQDGVDFDAAFAQAYQANPARAGLAFFAHASADAAAAAVHCPTAAYCNPDQPVVHAKR